jgi:hypothetical protein
VVCSPAASVPITSRAPVRLDAQQGSRGLRSVQVEFVASSTS